MSTKKKSDEPSYAELSGELETILDEIESGEIDLDELSDKVERAATLLSQCRKKLSATETKVCDPTCRPTCSIRLDLGRPVTRSDGFGGPMGDTLKRR